MANRQSGAGELSYANVRDEQDTTVTAPGPDLSGKRVRAIPAKGGTTVIVRRADFKNVGIDHSDVTWDFRVERFTVSVGDGDGQISAEAAKFLTENYRESFEYING